MSKHEGHGQLLLCALICKYNLSLVSVLSVFQGKSSGVPIGMGPRLCLSLAVVPMGTGQQKNAVEVTHNDNKRERVEENLHDAESGGSGTNLVVSGGEAMPSLLVDYGSSTLGK